MADRHVTRLSTSLRVCIHLASETKIVVFNEVAIGVCIHTVDDECRQNFVDGTVQAKALKMDKEKAFFKCLLWAKGVE